MRKKIIAILCALVMVLAIIPMNSFAEDEVSTADGSFSMLNYNVAGLPDFKALIGKSTGNSVSLKEKTIGNILENTGIDFIAVQEDFNFHKTLANEMKSYTAKTCHSGGVPFGDGMNIYAKTNIYNVEREEWRTRYGVFDEGDELTPKGILYAVIEIADGVYADFYDIHADAFDTEGSRQARIDNYNQLAEMIERHNSDRPVIITGDFNISIHLNGDPSGLYIQELFIDKLGFKDAWIETANGGDYNDYSKWYQSGMDYWGHWDSVEKFLYRDGNGIHLDPTSFEYITFVDDDGNPCSDHNAAKVVFDYTLGEDFVAENSTDFQAEVPETFIEELLRKIKTFMNSLITCLVNLDSIGNFINS